MEIFPWDDHAISQRADNTTSDVPRSLSVTELAALGLPVDDPFWMSPEAFEAHLAEVEGQGGEQNNALGPDAPAAQNIRVASTSRAPLPSLDPRRKAPGKEELPLTVKRAIVIIATPHAPESQAVGAAAYLLKWYQVEYQRRPTVDAMVLWWWKAARCLVHFPDVWADEFKVLWKRPGLDPSEASVNAFFGHLSRHASRLFRIAQGHHSEDTMERKSSRHARLR